uniref:Uncharacterized protein n=1 Tax=Anguilla anguilla TaxID=7936 RepID=A0A0E9XNP7_ANGAN
MHLPTGIQMWTEPEPEGSLTSISGDDSSSDTGKCSRVDRKYKRREKNRAAAPPTGFALPDLLDSAEWPQLWDTVW